MTKEYVDKEELLSYLRERKEYYLSLGSIPQFEAYSDIIDNIMYMSCIEI